MRKILIIGGGECAVRAAFTLRESGFDGAVTIVSSESVLPYERPPLSKEPCVVAKAIRKEEAYAEAKINLQLGSHAESIDSEHKQVHLADGSVHSYDQLLIATGAHARIFPGMEECLTLRTDEDARRIFAQIARGVRLGIIGGGFIGLELAATARKAGAEVTVVEAAPRVLARAVPEAIADVVHARHKAEGVKLLTGTQVAKSNRKSITLGDGTHLEFDLVVAGVGAAPNTKLAETAGLHADNGIVVDKAFRTSARDIYAAGDCCNFEWRGERVRLESWKAAQDQGAHVATTMLGGAGDYSKAPWFWSDQYDLTLQVAGLFDLEGEVFRRQAEEGTFIVFQLDADGKLKAGAGIGPGNSVSKDIKILEKLIERGAAVDPAELADPSFNIKRLLKAA